MRNAKVVWHKNDDAVSPVIGTILMVAITVVLAAVLWLMVSGMIGGADDERITVNLQTPDVQAAEAARYGALSTVYDATLNINKITAKDEKVMWSEVRIIIKGSTGSVLQAASPLVLDAGAYDTDLIITGAEGANAVLVQFWYVETTGDTKMGAGDAIKVTGMPTTPANWEGATIELTKAGERIAEATLPTDFE